MITKRVKRDLYIEEALRETQTEYCRYKRNHGPNQDVLASMMRFYIMNRYPSKKDFYTEEKIKELLN